MEEQEATTFDIYTFKVNKCVSKKQCACDNYHHEYERRRDPWQFPYQAQPCQYVFKGSWGDPKSCAKLDKCPFSHTVNEASYHPKAYKTKPCHWHQQGYCQHGAKCFYAHGKKDRKPKLKPLPTFVEQQEEQKQEIKQPIQVQQKPQIKKEVKQKEIEVPVAPKTEVVNPVLQQQMQELSQKILCNICMENQKNTALIPCGHAFCEDCINRTIVAECPNCRKKVEKTQKLNLN